LADYVLARHYPALQNTAQPIVALLEAIVARQAKLIARWMQVGFIHGVMNTDNMTVSGETIDFGPCAFMDAYHPATVYSAIDRGGRYAYANQPRIGMWNLARLAETLIPHIDPVAEKAVEIATASLLAFQSQYTANWLHRELAGWHAGQARPAWRAARRSHAHRVPARGDALECR
ncbi:MAG: protein adenylyltransferase SelO family protein, partial [Proteobacteria bacterium]|nr:protein adenylyltransferase SelO family protein [Pseudomonadota bacterium]